MSKVHRSVRPKGWMHDLSPNIDESDLSQITLVDLIGLWEALTIQQPYTVLLQRYAEIMVENPEPCSIGDRVALKLKQEFERRGMSAPIADWAKV